MTFPHLCRRRLSLCRCLPWLAALGLLAQVQGAAPLIRLNVTGGTPDQTPAIVTFDVPPDWKGEHLLASPDGAVQATLQVGETGRAAMVLNRSGRNEPLVLSRLTQPLTAQQFRWSIKEEDGRLRIQRVDGNGKSMPVFEYQMQAGDVPEGVPEVFRHGAHLHPVYSPSGRLLTGNHPADHRWHRGIWMAWTKTEFGESHPDFWNMGKPLEKGQESGPLLAEVRFARLMESWGGPVQAGFVSQHRFLDHNHGLDKPVLDETWEVTAYGLTIGNRPVSVVDLVSTQTCATSQPLNLPEYHYGGLGVRGHADWNPVDKVTMLTSNGDDRQKGDSTPAKWVHMGGEVDGQPAGMAILIHPENFRFPQPLRLNPKNPQLCIAPSQSGAWSIQPGQPYVSKYRFLLMDGPVDAALIEALWKAYANPPQVQVVEQN